MGETQTFYQYVGVYYRPVVDDAGCIRTGLVWGGDGKDSVANVAPGSV